MVRTEKSFLAVGKAAHSKAFSQMQMQMAFLHGLGMDMRLVPQ